MQEGFHFMGFVHLGSSSVRSVPAGGVDFIVSVYVLVKRG